MLLTGYQLARTWTTGWTGVAGANFGVGGGTMVNVGGATAITGVSESQSGTGLFYLGGGELVVIGNPQYRAQVTQIYMGAGSLGFNGGGQSTIIGVPLYVARVANTNAVAAVDYFLGGKPERRPTI